MEMETQNVFVVDTKQENSSLNFIFRPASIARCEFSDNEYITYIIYILLSVHDH